ncbi:hypothetical protein VC83_08277 [Pseudogymnoascus destructans]|uniref:BZIP domain-containing protein n=1 Tax=Pseudogymnoascus destructans TaxID=655981 RepID=A0A177A003_9PEZI|nr:uncharacterized protein VC83_08277 [Pseudogymnoascus destructans]OAF55427.1 hypothetical protein VC83_08277 [Pseudogymnoascus destructans]
MENSPTDTAKKENPSPTEPATATNNTTPPKTDTNTIANDADSSSTNADADAETTDPTLLPPPPRPSSNSGTSNNNNSTNSDSDTYFAPNQPAASHLSFEPNPFEHSFAGGGSGSAGEAQTPGGTKLPPVASITSPSSLLRGGGTTPYPWGTSSLRTGPLSPAMLSGPTGDYFGDTNHLRGGFTPNESSLRTGLTPGGGGTMFPTPSPNSQAIFNQLAGAGTATPTVDFHRSALAASHRKQSEAPTPSNITSQPQRDATNGDHAATTPAKQRQQQQREPFAQHDANDAANGLFLLASLSRTNSVGPGASGQYAMAPQQPVHAHPSGGASQPRERRNGSQGGGGGVSEGSEDSEGRSSSRVARGKGRKGGAGARRKAEEVPVASKAPPAKKGKHGGMAASQHYMEPEPPSEEEDVKQEEYNANGKKMTDEEKRKNFLERNRVAALKCRQRKKQWLANLQQKVEIFSSENDSLTNQLASLREEVIQLKTRLLAHKDCPVSQSQAMGGYLGGIEFGGGGMRGVG